MAKYKVTRTDGVLVPEGEPYFVIRAKDVFAVPIMEEYLVYAEKHNLPQEFLSALRSHIADVITWQREHRDKVKIPD